MKPKTVGRAGRAKLNPAGHMAQRTLRYPGVLLGANILTMNGEIPVQRLCVGDRLITRDSGVAAIQSIFRHDVERRAVMVHAGSLSALRPDVDVVLAADQTVLLRDWRARVMYRRPQAVAAAGALVDGKFITDLGLRHMTLFQIYCDAPHIFYSQGLELGTADALAQMPKTRIAA